MASSVDWDIVAETRQELAEMTPPELAELQTQMQEEQPILRGYLLQAADKVPVEEKERLAFLGLLIWQCMSRGTRTLGRVTKTRIQRAVSKNADLMRSLAQDTDADFYSAITAMVESYPEPQVLRAVAEGVGEPGAFREELIAPAFTCLKIGLDALTYSLWR